MAGGGALLFWAGGVVAGADAGAVVSDGLDGVVTLGVGGWSAGCLLQPPSKASDMAAPSKRREVRVVIIFPFYAGKNLDQAGGRWFPRPLVCYY